MRDRRSRATLVAAGIVPGVAGGVRMRWQALSHALQHASRMSAFLVRSSLPSGCSAGCDRSDHQTGADPNDPFADHFCPKLFDDLVAHIRSTKTTIVVITNLQLHRFVRELAELRICRIVYDMHNVEYPLSREIQACAPRQWREPLYSDAVCLGLKQTEGSAIAAADQIWTCSDADSRRVCDTYGDRYHDKLRVVPNAVEVPRKVKAHAPLHVLFPGRFDYYPNVQALQTLVTKVAPRLAGLMADVPVILAGSGLNTVRVRPRSDNVKLLADPTPAEMNQLIARSVMTLPLDLGGGTRFKVLEACASKAPVVSTLKGIEGIDLMDHSHYLRAETIDEFVDATTQLMRDHELRRHVVEQAADLVRRKYSLRTLTGVVGDRLGEYT